MDHCRYAKEGKRAVTKLTAPKLGVNMVPDKAVCRIYLFLMLFECITCITAKRVMQVWKETGVITKEGFIIIQEMVNTIAVQIEDAHRCIKMFCRSFENRW